MRVGDRLLALASPDVGVDRAALDRAGADERHLHHQVVEGAGFEPGQRGHLGPGLDLEHAHRVGPAEHVVDLLVGAVEHGQVELVAAVLADEVDRVVQRREHPEAEQVELHEAGRRAVVLVPLEDAALGHAAPLDRAHLDDRPVAQHHAARVDAEVAREVLHLRGQLEHRGRDGDVVLPGGGGHRSPAVDLLRPRVLLAGRGAERLGHVADGRLRAVGDDVGDLRGVVAPVRVVDVLDHLLAPVALDVEVDVRRAVALGGEEALEQQAEAHCVGVGDVEGVADRRVGGRAAPLAEDPLVLAEPHDVPDDEEVAGEAELLDEVELVGQLRVGAGHPLTIGRAVALGPGRLLGHQAPEVAHLVEAVGARERRQVRGDQPQVERALEAELGGPLHHTGVAGEAAGLLGPRAQVGAGPGREPPLHLVEAAAGPHRGERGGQRPARRVAVVDVVGGHQVDPGPDGDVGQGVVAGRVQRAAVVPQLDRDRVPPEPLDQLGQPAGRHGRAVGFQRGRHRPLPAPGEHRPVAAPSRRAAGQLGQLVEGEPRRPLLPRHLAPADGPGQPPVAHRVAAPAPAGGCPAGPAAGSAARPLPGRNWRACERHALASAPISGWGAVRGSWRVSSAPKMVGRPRAEAASAKRTTP